MMHKIWNRARMRVETHALLWPGDRPACLPAQPCGREGWLCWRQLEMDHGSPRKEGCNFQKKGERPLFACLGALAPHTSHVQFVVQGQLGWNITVSLLTWHHLWRWIYVHPSGWKVLGAWLAPGFESLSSSILSTLSYGILSSCEHTWSFQRR